MSDHAWQIGFQVIPLALSMPIRLVDKLILLICFKRCFPLRRVINQRHNHVNAASLGLAICDCKERQVC
jgi:hypothetical protein